MCPSKTSYNPTHSCVSYTAQLTEGPLLHPSKSRPNRPYQKNHVHSNFSVVNLLSILSHNRSKSPVANGIFVVLFWGACIQMVRVATSVTSTFMEDMKTFLRKFSVVPIVSQTMSRYRGSTNRLATHVRILSRRELLPSIPQPTVVYVVSFKNSCPKPTLGRLSQMIYPHLPRSMVNHIQHCNTGVGLMQHILL